VRAAFLQEGWFGPSRAAGGRRPRREARPVRGLCQAGRLPANIKADRGMKIAKTVILWVSGIIASAIFGALIGSRFGDGQIALLGGVGGTAAFTCARIWWSERRSY
jgi:hypothetical protein